jgi:hypothetical protein
MLGGEWEVGWYVFEGAWIHCVTILSLSIRAIMTQIQWNNVHWTVLDLITTCLLACLLALTLLFHFGYFAQSCLHPLLFLWEPVFSPHKSFCASTITTPSFHHVLHYTCTKLVEWEDDVKKIKKRKKKKDHLIIITTNSLLCNVR